MNIFCIIVQIIIIYLGYIKFKIYRNSNYWLFIFRNNNSLYLLKNNINPM